MIRYHTWPHIKGQTVAEHSWNVQRILISIWPDVPMRILVHALLHDIGEVSTGDLPFPVKHNNAKLKNIMDTAENAAHVAMRIEWGIPAPIKLTGEEKIIFKCADYIEMLEWAWDEINMGNSMAEPVFHRCIVQIKELKDELQNETIIANIENYIKRRRLSNEPYGFPR